MADQDMSTTPMELEKVSLKPIKGSKKSKKSWRKHTDIADVEEYLEEVRRDERAGGPIDDKPDDALFFVEKITEQKSGQKRVKGKREGIEVDDDDEEEYVPRKHKLDKKLQGERKELEKKVAEARAANVQTIWGQEVMIVTDAYIEHTVKKPKVKPSTVNVGKADVDAVIVAEPGASYNPDFDSHQELLHKAHEEELAIVTEQTKLSKTVRMVSVTELKKQSKLWIKEMSEGLSLTGDDSQDTEPKGPVFTGPIASASKRKTAQQRRKQLLLKKMNQTRLAEKKKKLKLNDILRLKSLKKEIANETNTAEEIKTIAEAISNLENKPKRLGKYKFVEGPTDVQLSDELSGSLRKLKPEGSLVRDRFKSLQRRNIIETRNRVLPRRRYKRKDVVRRSYKNNNVSKDR